jgi:hypothetical protein
MRDHRAAIPVAQVLVVHPTVLLLPPHLVVLLLRDQVQIVQDLVVLPLHQDRRQSQRVPIVNVAVKIYRLEAVHPIVVVQRVRYRRGVKPVIHAGFVLSR